VIKYLQESALEKDQYSTLFNIKGMLPTEETAKRILMIKDLHAFGVSIV